MRRTPALLTAAVLWLAGCAAAPSAQVEEVGPDTSAVRHGDGTVVVIPTTEPTSAADALTGGALVRLDGGCLGLRVAGGSPDGDLAVLVRWPYGTTWDPEQQVLWVSRLQPGGVQRAVRLGDEVSLGGGTWGGPPLVPECRADEVWSAS